MTRRATVRLTLPVRVPPYPRVTMTRVKAEGRKDRVFMGNAEGHKRLAEFYTELGYRVPAKAKLGLLGPISVELEIGIGPQGRGDIDNYAKSFLDACTKVGIWKDDRAVDRLLIERVKVPRGAEYLKAVIVGVEA